MVESIAQVCKKHILAPDTTIHSLVFSSDAYAVGSIGEILICCHQNNKQLELNIKDSEAAKDNAIVSLLLK